MHAQTCIRENYIYHMFLHFNNIARHTTDNITTIFVGKFYYDYLLGLIP